MLNELNLNKTMHWLRICDSPTVHAMTTNLYFSPSVQRYSKDYPKDTFSTSEPSIRIKSYLCERKLIYGLCNTREKWTIASLIQKDYAMQKEQKDYVMPKELENYMELKSV